MELHDKATAALSWFTTGERKSDETGRQITMHRDESPQWLKDLCYHAHDDGDAAGAMLPDDFRYEFIEEALQFLADDDNNPDEYEPEPSIYNAELHRWVSSHGWRSGYCDEAREEFGGEAGTLVDQIMLGQQWEMRRVFDRVRSFLDDLDEDAVTTRTESQEVGQA